MATLLLQVAGASIGGALGGPIGAIAGRALGAVAGYAIDQRLFGSGRSIEGPRLEHSQYLSSEEGVAIPRVYGRARVSGQVIWGTRFEEVQKTEEQNQGGKGSSGTTVTSYSYFANFAIGLCEGPVATVRRIWADGRLLDQTNLTIRLHKGDENQQPDSLIEAKQGSGNAPAYRGTAYLVFERLPLANFGNRIPQISVELIKPVGDLEKNIKAVSLIPGATEFGYDPLPVRERINDVSTKALNAHSTVAVTDWTASLDELQAICPDLQHVALVCTWFGTDLRAGNCICTPKVEAVARSLSEGEAWVCSGETRGNIPLVTLDDDRPVFGGTPSDGSILRAIADLKARELKVTFYPFLMMDIPSGNALPDPYGEGEQSVYPWRGRITCHPAPHQPSSPDRSATAKSQVDAFFGAAQSNQFSAGQNTVNYTGPNEWSFRRLILHYAHLCQMAGGVDTFYIGSEMRSLTSVRGSSDTFPAVDQLVALASDVRTILGNQTKISYAADWSEYFGYQPHQEPGNVYFHLDPLWSSADIDAVSIDNYMPLTDWRDEGEPNSAARLAADPDAMARNIAGGEGFDWYYASDTDRRNGSRSTITDGLAGKPWVFRYKDLISWWGYHHYDRSSGVELSNATGWVPQSKPIWFSELGCPAIDKGANQPNVFVDPKSSENAFPYFSTGARDDFVQAAMLQAHQRHWDPDVEGFQSANNPVSSSYSGRMLDPERTYLWAWDARPFPNFPDDLNTWSDGTNWKTGHWLNGRIGGARLSDLVSEILNDHGYTSFDVSELSGSLDGYIVGENASARSTLEPLLQLFNVAAIENGEELKFSSLGRDPAHQIEDNSVTEQPNEPLKKQLRDQETDIPNEVHVRHLDPTIAFNGTTSTSRRIESGSQREASLQVPAVVSQDVTISLANEILRQRWSARRSIEFRLPWRFAELQAGDHISFTGGNPQQRWQVTSIDDAEFRTVKARAIEFGSGGSAARASRAVSNADGVTQPDVSLYLLDLPVLKGTDASASAKVAAAAYPWPGSVALYSSPAQDGYSLRQTIEFGATAGQLAAPLGAGEAGRFVNSHEVQIELFTGSLSSLETSQVLNGANTLALQSSLSGWEVLQFSGAELIAGNQYRLTGLLRGQGGTEPEMEAGAAIGARAVLINQAVEDLSYVDDEIGLLLNWTAVRGNGALSAASQPAQPFAPGERGRKPLRPVHLQSQALINGDLVFSWVRRDRIGADNWTPTEIPMSEQVEAYQVTIRNSSSVVRQVQTSSAGYVYTAADQSQDQTQFTGPFSMEVSQISQFVGPGPAASIAI
ncbi:MAG: glycoside hydrolase TIM-barrel-like domain-containing protein [Pseudomonadota bacterium]